MSEGTRLPSTDHPTPLSRLGARCDVLRATLLSLPVPLLVVALMIQAWPLPFLGVALAVAVAAVSAAVTARWCAERRMRADLAWHRRELEHTKRQILGLVSHELRTPVTGVVGFSRTLSGRLDSLDRETLRLFVDAIDEHANRLSRLIDNVVVASRAPLASGTGTCEVSQTLSNAVARVGLAADSARLHITIQTAVRARIDEEAAIRILANLLDNAVKFGDPDAAVHIDGRQRGDRVVLRVANAGPAIPLGVRPALYDPFVQGDQTDTRTADGLGLGLHVCRQLVEAYGGSIDLVDHPRLIVFEVVLPAASDVAPSVPSTAAEPGARSGIVLGAGRHPRDPVADPPTTVPTHPPASAGAQRERVG